jgi:hypothetical protein
MRLVQRHGRIDRIGSRHSEVFLRCVFPDQRLDDLLGLEQRLERTRGFPKLFQDSLAIHRTPLVIPCAYRHFHRAIHRSVHSPWNSHSPCRVSRGTAASRHDRRPGSSGPRRRRLVAAAVVVVPAAAEAAEQTLPGTGRGLGHPADRADERVR